MYLNSHTYFSMRYGVMSPAELLATARSMGIGTLALTDINNTSAALEFVRLAPQYHIKPVLGIDFRNGVEQQFVALARNNHGFMALNRFLSQHLHQQRPFPAQAPGLRHSYIIYPFGKHPIRLRPNEYIGIGLDDLPRLRLRQGTTPLHKLVILQPITFRHQRDFNIHRLLRAIDLNTLLSKVPPQACGRPQHRPVAPEKLLEAFSEFPEALYNTRQLLDNCQIYFEFGEQYPHKNQRTYTGSARKDFALLKKLCYRALPERYRQPTPHIYARLEKELAVIHQKDAVAYFLINWDIVSYARSKGYFYVGRGSGANSLVAYLLRITDVDPIDLDLYFERFINLYRKNPPDFDIDFASTDRDDVIAYIFRRFKHIALLATYNTFQQRAAVRELG
ncbi:MAG TPA: PHP domain-containing protein, partial [Flammeovirgaceae bacterium]|nr:PHP domain-containing protein [Flammeovirgaceae bacterium]